MAEIEFKFRGDASHAVNEAGKLTVSLERIEKAARGVSREAKAAGDTIASSFAKAEGPAAKIGASFSSMVTAMNSARELGAKVVEVLDKISAAQDRASSRGRAIAKETLGVVQSSPLGGLDAAGRDKMNAAIARMGQQGVSPADAARLLAEVSSASPGAGIDRWTESAKAAASQAAAMGADPVSIASQHAKLRGLGVPESQIPDLTAFAAQNRIDLGSKDLAELLRRGADPAGALGIMAAGRGSALAGYEASAKAAGVSDPGAAALHMLLNDPAVSSLRGQVAGSAQRQMETRRGLGQVSSMMDLQEHADREKARGEEASLNADYFAQAEDKRLRELERLKAQFPVVGSLVETYSRWNGEGMRNAARLGIAKGAAMASDPGQIARVVVQSPRRLLLTIKVQDQGGEAASADDT